MTLETCENCDLFELRKNQNEAQQGARAIAEQFFKDIDTSSGRIGIMVGSGVGDRRCSSNRMAFGMSDCEKPLEFRRRE